MFGVTVESVRSYFFSHSEPFDEGTKPTLAAANEIVENTGSEILLILASKGIDPKSITRVGSEHAYNWLADTLSLAAAIRIAQIGALGTESEAVTSWIRDYEGRKEYLKDNAATFLGSPVRAESRIRHGGFSREPTFTIEDDN